MSVKAEIFYTHLSVQVLQQAQEHLPQAAQALGYDSTTAFITMFKKGLGQTPARYIASLTTTSR